jgi:hypothetical protein
MLGNTHAMYGFIVAEIIFAYFIVRRYPSLLQKYNRPMLWITGMFGAWSPDLDGASGIFNHQFLDFHRDYSHSLVFLFITLLLIVIYIIFIFNHRESYKVAVENPSIFNPAGQVPMEKDMLHIYTFIIMLASFFILSSETYYYAFAFIAIATLGFGLSFIKTKLPFYGLAFFLGALSHHVCDFIACEWNPYGPWSPWDPQWGLFLWCGDIQWGNIPYMALFTIFEILPHLIFVLLLIRYFKTVNSYKFKMKSTPTIN